MPAPTPEDIDLARRGARAALRRLAERRFPEADTDEASGCIAVVETLWWVRLLAEQLNYPHEAYQKLRGNSDSESEADLVAALRVVRNTVTHKVPVVSRQIERRTVPGKNLLPGAGVHPGSYRELCWIPVDELPESDPRFAKHWEEDKADYAAHIADQPCYGSLYRAVRWLTGDAPKYRSDGTLVVLPPEAVGVEMERETGGSGVVLG